MKLHHLRRYPSCFSYQSRGHKKYGYRFTYEDNNKHRHNCQKKGFKAALQCYKASMERRKAIKADNSDNVTVNGYISRFLSTRELHCKRSTCESYRVIFKNYVEPYLGNLAMRDVTRQKFDELCMRPLVLRHLRHRTLASVADRVSTLMNDAVENNVITRNPLYKYHAPKGEPAIKKQIMNDSQLIKFNQTLDQGPLRYQVAFYTLEETGMRIGELLGLFWKDIDFKNNRIHIRHTRDWYGLRTPKTKHSLRDVELTKHLKVLYLKYAKYCKEKYNLSSNDFLLRNNQGKIMANNALSRELKSLLTNAGLLDLIGKFTCHTFRHMFISRLIKSGADIIDVSHYVGHSNPGITLAIYSNFVPGTKNKFGTMFDNLFSSKK